MTGLLMVGAGMLLVLVAQFFAIPEKRRGSPVGVFFVGGYWFDELRRPGQVLLAAGWTLAVAGFFVAFRGWGVI